MAEEEQARTPFLEQVRSLGGIYWIANWMELVERFAYYGVRVVLPVYMVLAISEGGPELTHIQKGTIYAIWALVQSFIPIFSGTFADRYGYKNNIAVSTVLKIIGYVLMGYCIALAEGLAGMPLSEARPIHADHTFEIFFAGAMFLALGTAIFKPGVQGLIAVSVPDRSAGLGWGIFYQCVNIGGFIGPMVAGYLRILSWENVFLTCAGAIALNFVPLFFFKEPQREGKTDERTVPQLLLDALRGLLEPRLFFFTIAFAGFWLMFYQLFDILPNFIDDWIDSRGAAGALASLLPWDGAVPTLPGGNLTQEWIINFNAGLCATLSFLFGYIAGKFRSLIAIVVGIGVSAIGIYALGLSMNGWATFGAIGIFSMGEMMASPTKMRYLSSIAPPGRKGQYMGYVNMTVGIGWSIGSVIAGNMYEEGGDKVNLARRYLEEHLGMSHAAAHAIDRGAVMETFMERAEVDAWGARDLLWDVYDPQGMWVVFTVIGIVSMVLLVIYDRVIAHAKKVPSFSFNTYGRRWVQAALIPTFVALVIATGLQLTAALGEPDATIGGAILISAALIVNSMLIGLLLIGSFVLAEEKHDDVAKPTEF